MSLYKKDEKGGTKVMKKKKNHILLALMSMFMFMSSVVPVSAATYQRDYMRGTPKMIYTKSTLLYTVKNSKVTSSDAYQSKGGIGGMFVNNRGTQKLDSLSSSKQHVYLSKHEFLVGAVLSGQTLGFSQIVHDRMTGRSNGTSTVIEINN